MYVKRGALLGTIERKCPVEIRQEIHANSHWNIERSVSNPGDEGIGIGIALIRPLEADPSYADVGRLSADRRLPDLTDFNQVKEFRNPTRNDRHGGAWRNEAGEQFGCAVRSGKISVQTYAANGKLHVSDRLNDLVNRR